MTGKTPVPDYELDERLELASPTQVRAIGHPLRTTILSLLGERAATITEIAQAVRRPKSTIAFHIDVLARAGLVKVVRTRRVRAIDERYFGRTARMFYMRLAGERGGTALPRDFNDFEVAAAESQAAYSAGRLRAFLRHARITEDQAAQFWSRVDEIIHAFDEQPREGATAYGFAVGLYPVPDYPTLPPGAPDDKVRRG